MWVSRPPETYCVPHLYASFCANNSIQTDMLLFYPSAATCQSFILLHAYVHIHFHTSNFISAQFLDKYKQMNEIVWKSKYKNKNKKKLAQKCSTLRRVLISARRFHVTFDKQLKACRQLKSSHSHSLIF